MEDSSSNDRASDTGLNCECRWNDVSGTKLGWKTHILVDYIGPFLLDVVENSCGGKRQVERFSEIKSTSHHLCRQFPAFSVSDPAGVLCPASLFPADAPTPYHLLTLQSRLYSFCVKPLPAGKQQSQLQVPSVSLQRVKMPQCPFLHKGHRQFSYCSECLIDLVRLLLVVHDVQVMDSVVRPSCILRSTQTSYLYQVETKMKVNCTKKVVHHSQ
jgi:hypothetical protein